MGRVCLVAGAGPGLGRAIAARFSREGFDVALLSRRQEALDAMASELPGPGAGRGYAVDLTDLDALSATIARVGNEMGPVEVLVYNASGLFEPTDPMGVDPHAFDTQLRLCATSAFTAVQAVMPAMRAAGRGTILLTGGGLALTPETAGPVAALATGKAALRALAKILAPVAAKDGVHLATITVAGPIGAGTAFDPDRIADEYWDVHGEPQDSWSVERIFRGDPT